MKRGTIKNSILIISLAAALIAIASIVFLNIMDPGGGQSLAQARKAGMIRVGYSVEAPYAFITPDGRVTGESPELARIIAARLGIPKIEWRLTEFHQLLEGLETGRFDVIAAGMFITPERQRLVSFSLPTFKISQGLLVYKGNPLGLHSYADIPKNPRAKIAVLSGSVEETAFIKLGCSEQQILRVPDAEAGRAAVRSRQADALALSAPTLRWMVAHPIAGLTEMAEPFVNTEFLVENSQTGGAFAFRKSDRALISAWNSELKKFIGSPEHISVVREFGFTSEELPGASSGKGAK